MKRAILSPISAFTAAAFLLTACSDLPPGQPGPFTNGAVAGGDLARASTVTSAESFATGSSAGTVATATIVILAKHQATLRQQQVAKANAKKAIAKLRAKLPKTAKVSEPPTSGMNKKTATAAKKKPQAAPEKSHVAHEKKPGVHRIPRYIAVETEKDERTVPQAQKSVVIFDTETQEIVGNNVYDVKSAPPVGATTKFETFTAEYVGSGN